MSAAPPPLPGPGDQVFLVDGSSFVFRAYFQSMNQDRKYNTRAGDNLPTGAVRLFCTKLMQFIRDGATGLKPTHLAIVFDKSEVSFRNELYADYKAHRPDPPAELIPQFGLMREAVRAFGLVPIEQGGFEADDIIATYACQASANGAEVLIVSSDKDLMQMVRPGVTMYDFESGIPGKPGHRPERRLDRDGVIDKFGVPPEKVIDVQALIGDPTDNVPGVPGIGPKAAATIVSEVGSIDKILSYKGRASELDAFLQEKLNKYQSDIDEVAGRSIKIGSGAQIADILQTRFGISDLPRDKKGSATIDAALLESLAIENEWCRAIVLARNLSRVIGSAVQKILDADEQARISKKLVTLTCDMEVDVPLGVTRIGDFDPKPLVAFGKALRLDAFVKRVATLYDVDPDAVDPDPVLSRPWDAASGAWLDGDALAPPVAQAADESRGSEGATSANGSAGPSPARTPAVLAEERKGAMRALAFDTARYRTLSDLAELDRWIAAAREHGEVAIDLVTEGPDPMRAAIVGIALALEPGLAGYIPLAHRSGEDLLSNGLVPDQIAEGEALARLKPLLEDGAVLKVGQNIKRDALTLRRHGIDMAPLDDVMLVSYALDAGRAGLANHGLDAASAFYLGHAPAAVTEVTGKGRGAVAFALAPLDRATQHAAESPDVAIRLHRVLKPRLAAERMTTVYETLERPLVPVLARMEERGIQVDRQILSRMSGDFAQTIARVEDEVYETAGERFTIGSPKQLAEILFGKFGLPGAKKTATGQWSTGARLLEDLSETSDHPLPRKVLEWRQLTKLKSYTDALPTYIHPETGRVHTSYSLAATTTGRLSSTDPNLQNIPIRTEEGRKIRQAFVPAPGMKLVSADYSQIELRILAHMADIPQLVDAFANGIDIHATTASEMFGVPVEGMPPEIRRRAKAINFGIVYGISAFGLANQLGIPRAEASDYIRRYFERFPGIKTYMDETKRFCRETGYVRTIFGRLCHYPDITASNPSLRAAVERQAINAPIQGSAADIIRRAMVRMEDALAEAKLSARMLLQVHDELVFEVPDEEVEATLPVISRVMQDAPHPAAALKVPLAVDARAGANWDAAH
ncbi:DNA polymerase I [Enterovirga rhinocerotis]|uniref:DNA polymerase I n=1 Tax=Enterovirga rhinocerotis TaxID=1339210 RepID=A0A4V3DYW8_9HYPH|nr:DNA polymerase I [Enterovirga rhinocerotis]TDR93679.1 DNA polymerase I [Enterovirga rhinocerotis]